MKKILIISSDQTGHGHKSIASSLREHLELDPCIQVEVVEGFRFLGRLGVKAGGMYGPITRLGNDFWKLAWDISTSTPETLVQILKPLLHDRLMQSLKSDPPNLIVSIHPVFNAAVLDVLREHNIHVPFVTLLADLVDIHPLWVDSRANYILCPTDEALNACLMLGAPRTILKRCGFPTRRSFTDAARNCERKPYIPDRTLEVLLMSGGEGSGNLRAISELLLNNFNARVTVICGRNTRMREALTRHLGHFGERMRILGFCENVQDYMLEADVAIMRGSPNSMMEAVVCNTPLIVTGSLPGQEERNPDFAQMHGLGVNCRKLSQLLPLMRGLLENNAEELEKMAEKQRHFRNLNNAADIAKFLVDNAQENKPLIPDFECRFPKLMQAAELYRRLESSAAIRREKLADRNPKL